MDTVRQERRFISILILVLFLAAGSVFAQPRYRTFSQNDLAQKKTNAGKVLQTISAFVFRNDSLGFAVNGLYVRFNSSVISIQDSGGFTSFLMDKKGKLLIASGRTVLPGDSIVFSATFNKKSPGTHGSYWWWDTNGVRVGKKFGPLTASSYIPIRVQPNGGNVLEFLYKKVINRPAGLVVGIEGPPSPHWIRYMKADRKYFQHTGPVACFSFRRQELRNPHVEKDNDHLIGELHALKLAIIANDSGVTQPDTTATRLGDLIFNDLVNPDSCNGMTLRAIAYLADSALSYCPLDSSLRTDIDACISRVNAAFDGPYVAVSFSPFVLAGVNPLPAFLHPNPAAVPVAPPRDRFALTDDVPGQYSLEQNYPNPFNPTSTITYNLPTTSRVTLKVYNLLGQVVATLSEGTQEAGLQTAQWNATEFSSGVYFYRLEATSVDDPGKTFSQVKRMMLVK
ncbi:MAG TPA: T9SS type A sorting domain-containing protein [Bacteroidota bacterium]|nr:T9SS type A sorting domain-containing protein [Bacteroidota bacterium]